MSEPVITNSTAKVLKFIRKHQNCSFETLAQRFNGLDHMELVNLALTGYLLCTRPGELPDKLHGWQFFRTWRRLALGCA